MTERELEQIESGLRVLSYECDEVLNSGIVGNNFFHLYFNYTGFIIHLKNKDWQASEVRKTLLKFPRLIQPIAFIFIPLFFYSVGLYFTNSFLAVIGYFLCMSLVLFAGYLWIKSKLRRDLLKVISLCSEMRLNIHKFKKQFPS